MNTRLARSALLFILQPGAARVTPTTAVYSESEVLQEPQYTILEKDVYGQFDGMKKITKSADFAKFEFERKLALPEDVADIEEWLMCCKHKRVTHCGVVAKLYDGTDTLIGISGVTAIGLDDFAILAAAPENDDTNYTTQVVDKDGAPVEIDAGGDTIKLFTKTFVPASPVSANVTVSITVDATTYEMNVNSGYYGESFTSDEYAAKVFTPFTLCTTQASVDVVFAHKKHQLFGVRGAFSIDGEIDNTANITFKMVGKYISTALPAEGNTFEVASATPPVDILVRNLGGWSEDGNEFSGKQFTFDTGNSAEVEKSTDPTSGVKYGKLAPKITIKAYDSADFEPGYNDLSAGMDLDISIAFFDMSGKKRYVFKAPSCHTKQDSSENEDSIAVLTKEYYPSYTAGDDNYKLIYYK